MTNNYHDEETRREKDYQRLRTRNPICVGCGYSDHPAALELAHIAPRKFHDDGVVLCSNCHRVQSDTEKDYSYAPQSDNPEMETIGRYLLALSEFFQMIATRMFKYAEWLLEQSEHVLPYNPEEVA